MFKGIKLFKILIILYILIITVEPVYNELGYNEFPLINNYIVFTGRIDFFIN